MFIIISILMLIILVKMFHDLFIEYETFCIGLWFCLVIFLLGVFLNQNAAFLAS